MASVPPVSPPNSLRFSEARRQEMEEFRGILTHPSNIFIQVIADVFKLPKAKRCWTGSFFLPPSPHPYTVSSPRVISHSRCFHSPAVSSPPGSLVLVSLGAIESSYLYAASKGLPGFQHPDTAPFLVTVELLCSIEGPMWKLIRGLGLAYSFSIFGDADEGLVYFSLSRSTSPARAFSESKKLVSSFASSSTKIDAVALQNAKASVISAVVSREQTPSSTGLQAIMSALRGTGHGHNARLLEAVAAVKEEDCMRVLNTYLLNLFDPKASNMCVTTSPSKLHEICSSFEDMGWRVEQHEGLETLVQD
ncbi:hypothetical protein GUITHDRAFT_148450 [Guillardia theta CCMP2712]|uniref:Peptidase M16 C-terminal domain-containing protein n=1 Tax=Guillardia theta (strain CCMP2712) TaxID=905079 RepID=L1I8V1_GUITC|nr:hypothetical protein GUITHDRAFT_148450 [Guillardia theta CCMP2712]EKX32663.1 hypothetical protein GUITHDRAFT_148450 [Guillardia theta CCMP2712]|eukprot:XP_005819643.1 hypothetical protein GUITHDRAFT_148450 [Guillardia theta CCMP2712]